MLLNVPLRPGDLVLALFLFLAQHLRNRFTGPHVVERKLTDTSYVIRTPERRRDRRTCHINMLKQYHERERGKTSEVATVSAAIHVAVVTTVEESEEDSVESRLRSCGTSAKF